MLPSQTQRMLMLLAVVLATPAWWVLAGWLSPGDGLNGWGLSDARMGWMLAAGLVLLTALPGLVAAGFLAAAGNPLSGVFSVALAGVIATYGNSLVGVARRAADADAADALYPRLAAEMGLGVVILTLLLAGLGVSRRLWMGRVPGRLRSRHLGETAHFWTLSGKSVVAGLITAVVGGVLTAVLVRSADPQQVAGGLVLAFAIASLIGHSAAPNDRPWATLVAPAVVGVVGYAWALVQLRGAASPDALLSALYTFDLPGLALGLPLHYCTAGVLGCSLGLGIGQVIEYAKLGEA